MDGLTPERIAELQAQDLPPLTWQDVFTLKADSEPLADDDVQALNAYFGQFVKLPQNAEGHSLCLGCGASFGPGDALSSFLLAGMEGRATWEWSLAHGECHCSRCGYPARAYHYNIGSKDGREPIIASLRGLTLAVHPSRLRVREVASSAPSGGQ